MSWLHKLLGIECPVCVALRAQLEYEQARNKEMLDTLTGLLKPQVIISNHGTEPPKPITPGFQRWSRRKAQLERLDREVAQVKANSPVIAKPDKVEDLEKELEIQ